jgi:hypothetical protein
MSGYPNYTKGALQWEDKIMSLDHPNDAFENQDLIPHLNVNELRELSNLKEMRRSLLATICYFEERESSIFTEVRIRLSRKSEQ